MINQYSEEDGGEEDNKGAQFNPTGKIAGIVQF